MCVCVQGAGRLAGGQGLGQVREQHVRSVALRAAGYPEGPGVQVQAGLVQDNGAGGLRQAPAGLTHHRDMAMTTARRSNCRGIGVVLACEMKYKLLFTKKIVLEIYGSTAG